jgi:lipopolysaccharide transport system permease protein
VRVLYERRDPIWCLVAGDLKVRHRRLTLGLLWTMLLPLLNMLVLMTVFSTAIGFDIQNYPVYALAGILFWNFFHQSAVGP